MQSVRELWRSCRRWLTSHIAVHISIILPHLFPGNQGNRLCLCHLSFLRTVIDLLRCSCWNFAQIQAGVWWEVRLRVRKPGQGRARGERSLPSTLAFFSGCPAGIYFLSFARNFTLIILSPTVPWCWNQVLTWRVCFFNRSCYIVGNTSLSTF